MRLPAALALALALAACAARPPACPLADLAADAVEAGRSEADLVAAHPHCPPADLSAAYQRTLAARCAPERAWQDGLNGLPSSGTCRVHGRRTWDEAYNLALRYGQFSAELARIEARVEALEQSEDESDRAAARRINLQRVRLIRELDAIRGAARVRGWIDDEQ